jgi:flagellar motor switch protein FliN/FliY
VTETIEYEQFDQGVDGGPPARPSARPPASPSDPGSEVDLSRLSEIPMELSVEIGRTHMTVGETLDLRIGSVVTLERLAGETADLLVNGSAIARGEVVVIDEQYGLRITEILDGQADAGSSPAAEHAHPAGVGGGDLDGEQVPVPESAGQERPAASDGGESPAEESTPA